MTHLITEKALAIISNSLTRKHLDRAHRWIATIADMPEQEKKIIHSAIESKKIELSLTNHRHNETRNL